MSTKDSISIRYRATDTVYIADNSVGGIIFILIYIVKGVSFFCYIFEKTAIGDEKMGNIFENRKNWQLKKIGSTHQIQRLKEYSGEYRKVWEREKICVA